MHAQDYVADDAVPPTSTFRASAYISLLLIVAFGVPAASASPAAPSECGAVRGFVALAIPARHALKLLLSWTLARSWADGVPRSLQTRVVKHVAAVRDAAVVLTFTGVAGGHATLALSSCSDGPLRALAASTLALCYVELLPLICSISFVCCFLCCLPLILRATGTRNLQELGELAREAAERRDAAAGGWGVAAGVVGGVPPVAVGALDAVSRTFAWVGGSSEGGGGVGVERGKRKVVGSDFDGGRKVGGSDFDGGRGERDNVVGGSGSEASAALGGGDGGLAEGLVGITVAPAAATEENCADISAAAPAASTGTQGADDHECAICACEYEEGDVLRELACKHSFHAACVDRWITTVHGNCPTCRALVL